MLLSDENSSRADRDTHTAADAYIGGYNRSLPPCVHTTSTLDLAPKSGSNRRLSFSRAFQCLFGPWAQAPRGPLARDLAWGPEPELDLRRARDGDHALVVDRHAREQVALDQPRLHRPLVSRSQISRKGLTMTGWRSATSLCGGGGWYRPPCVSIVMGR